MPKLDPGSEFRIDNDNIDNNNSNNSNEAQQQTTPTKNNNNNNKQQQTTTTTTTKSKCQLIFFSLHFDSVCSKFENFPRRNFPEVWNTPGQPRWAPGADLKITNYHGKAIGAITINYRATTIIARQWFLFLLVIFVSSSDTQYWQTEDHCLHVGNGSHHWGGWMIFLVVEVVLS